MTSSDGDPGGSPEPTRLLPGRLRLDELLADLVERVQELQGQRQRLRVLLDDVVAIASGLSLEETLRRLVEAARELVDARYAALGIVAELGGLRALVTSGSDPETETAIGHLPEGHGILRDMASASPAGHPPTRSFLGVPISVREKVFGNLYLTAKTARPGFSEDDEQLVLALAGAAGIAIENARLYEQAELRQRWLRAGVEVSHRLLASADDPDLSIIASTALDVAGDDLVALWMPVGGPSHSAADAGLVCRAAAGVRTEKLPGTVAAPGASLSHEVMRQSRPRVVADVGAHGSAWHLAAAPPVQSALMLPLIAESGPLGVLVLARSRSRPPPSSDEVDMAQGFSNQVALALALVSRQEDRRKLAVFADRDRIARDLHDHVIQQLFASGLSLQGLAMTLDPEAASKIDQVAQSLDDTIGDLRRAIFSLRLPEVSDRGLRARLVAVVGQATAAGLSEPRLRLDGPMDAAVPQKVADDAIAVVREALSNATRHANATHVDVKVSFREGALSVSVTDNGVGLPATLTRRSGLRNLRSRAEARHGSFDIDSPAGGGTALLWQVPVDTDT
jgi:signal transduction histidine kinase